VERSVSFVRLTGKGREASLKAGDYFAQILEIAERFGGKLEATWALTGGAIDFVSIATYPDRISAFKARIKIEELGVVTVESFPVVDMVEYIQAAS
jgi:uncharacterized protein with GYD domain